MTRSIHGRVPVNDLEAETAVLSASMLKPECIPSVAAILEPASFYSAPHGRIFEAILDLHRAGTDIDPVTISAWLRARELLAFVGGIQYVTSLVDDTPAVSHVIDHAKVVRSKAQQRAVVDLGHRMVAEGYDDAPDVAEWASGWHQKLTEIVNGAVSADGGRPILGALQAAFTRVDAIARGDVGLRTGLVDVDRMLGGLRPGQVTMIGARSHVGKSSLARQIAASVASSGPAVFLWSGEQGYEEVGECMAYQQAGVAAANMADANRNSVDDWRRLTEAASTLAALPIYIEDRAAINPVTLRGLVRSRRVACESEHKTLKLVVVDYVQLMSARGLVEKGANREREVSTISKALKAIAMGEHVHLIVCAQLNREGQLRESDALKQDADKVLTLHNDALEERMKVYRMGERFVLPTSEPVDVVVEKARGGGTLGRTRLVFFPTCGRFESEAA